METKTVQVFFIKFLESSINLMIEISSEAVDKYPKPMAETYMLSRNLIKIQTPYILFIAISREWVGHFQTLWHMRIFEMFQDMKLYGLNHK